MNDHRSMLSTNEYPFKPVSDNLNDVRRLPVGWEDEILEILKCFDREQKNQNHQRFLTPCRRCFAGGSPPPSALRKNRRRNENNADGKDVVLRRCCESSPRSSSSSSSPSSKSTTTTKFSSQFSSTSSLSSCCSTEKCTQQQQQRRNNNCRLDNFNYKRKFSVDQQRQQTDFVLHALKLGFKLALKERDTLAAAYERFVKRNASSSTKKIIVNKKENMKTDLLGSETTSTATTTVITNGVADNENHDENSPSTKLNNNNYQQIEITNRIGDDNKKDAEPLHGTLSEVFIEPVDDEAEEVTTWEYRNVRLGRVAGYGFGIAVSGGRDNPHFKNGDPSIVVSDVLRAGPACGVLAINDRIVNANGYNLENADYATAVQIMKDSDVLNLVIKRRIRVPVVEFEQRTLKFTLSKLRKKDDFGIVLGCKFYVKEITNRKLAEKEPGLKENDVVKSINGQMCDDLTLAEARKLLEKSKERLSLIVQRDIPRGTNWKWSSQATLYERIGSETPRQSPTPRASPMVNSRYSDDGDNRLNCTSSRLSGRYAKPPPSNVEYACGSLKRQSCAGSSQSRTPNASICDGFSNGFSPKIMHTSPNFYSSQKDSLASPYGTTIESPAPSDYQHSLPSCSSEPRLVSFVKEHGSVGVRVIGGNEVGIFVSAVQPGSPASAQGVRCGDQILRVNERDMHGVTREEAVLYLLGLTDRVDLTVQYKRDEYERVRSNNLGDNFFIRVHFDNDKPENGELCFKKGDVFQIIDTLFGGTVGAWQAISVLTNEKTPAKGIIPNATRAEQLISKDLSRSSSKTLDDESKTSTLKRKMTLGRRSKSLTKNKLDEVVFSQDGGCLTFCAYERVKLRHPEFLRPVVLFGPLADVSREKLLQDYPLRFAAPQNETDEENQKKCGIIRLSSIKEIMDKNKHCLLDVTPYSVEKLQYAQYCPIVIYVNVDSRSRLKELRRKHSKAAAAKSSRKLMEDAAKIQKSSNYLFTATLDASRENEWFNGLLDLISRLQESRIWMGEIRPANILDDEFLFPLSYRFSNYTTAESDIESVKTDRHFEYGTLPARSHFNRDAKTSPVESTTLRRNDDYDDYAAADEMAKKMTSSMTESLGTFNRSCVRNYSKPSTSGEGVLHSPLYENHENFVEHFATFRRPNLPRPKVKPIPPPRQIFFSYNSSIGHPNSSFFPYNGPQHPQKIVKSPMANGARPFRQVSEPGLFDVKQILADHPERNCVFSPPPPPPPPPKYDDHQRTYHNGYVCRDDLPNHFNHAMHNDTYASSAMTSSLPLVRMSSSPNGVPPISIINPSFQEATIPNGGGKPAVVDRTNFVASRTSSMPPQPPQNSSRIAQNNLPVPTTNGGRGSAPPPAPAPRSPHPHSPRLTLPATTTLVPVNFEENVCEHQQKSPSPAVAQNNRTSERVWNAPEEAQRIDSASLKRPSRSPKPPIPEKPANLRGLSPLPVNANNSESNGNLLNKRGDYFANSTFEIGTNKSSNDFKRSPQPNDDGRRVLAEVSGVVGPDGGSLASDKTGVVLKIPPGALTTKHEIFFKVFQDSQMEPPLDKEKGETLLSPLLMCGPQGLKFQKPVELNLPHNASNENWSFALKSTNAAGVSQSQWKQTLLSAGVNERNGINDKYVTISIDHF